MLTEANMQYLNLIATSLVMVIASAVAMYAYTCVVELVTQRQTGLMAWLYSFAQNFMFAGLLSILLGGALMWLFVAKNAALK
jgi:hypothetical protein